jgi:hypothetical protein
VSIRVGGKYLYRIGDYVIDTYFLIESFDGTRYTGRAQCWTEAVWYFDSTGKQIGTQLSPNSGAPSVSLVLEDE